MVKPALTSLAVTSLLVGMVAFISMSIDLYLPALPAITQAFHTDPSRTQLTIGAFSFGMGTAQLVLGPLSDRFGRRPILLCGISVYFVASILCTLAGSIELLIAARFLQAIGACAGQVLARAIVRDVYERDRAAHMLALMMSAFTLAPMIAPLVGGYLQIIFGWQADFLVMALFAGIMLLASILILSESNTHPDMQAARPRRVFEIYRELLSHGQFRSFLVVQGCMMGSTFAFLSATPFLYAGALHGSPEHFGYFTGIIAIGFLCGNLATSHLVRRIGSARLMAFGMCIGLSGATIGLVLALLGIETFLSTSLPMAVIMIGAGLVSPNNLAEALAPFPRMAGSAAALLGSMQVLFPVFSGWVVVAMANGTAQPMYGYLILIWVVAGLTHFRRRALAATA